MNGQVRTLVHELVHALGVNYQTHTRPQAEVIVDTATLIILSGAGLDTSGETIPYVAGWGESGALEAVTEHAELIDRLARTVENAIAADTANDAATAEAVGGVTRGQRAVVRRKDADLGERWVTRRGLGDRATRAGAARRVGGRSARRRR